MKPFMFAPKPPPHREPAPLESETAALRAFLQSAKPQTIERAESAYRQRREERSQAREQFQTACAQHRAEGDNARPGSEQMRELEETIGQLDDEIGKAREKVGAARAAWFPKYRCQLKLHLNAADAALADAAALIGSAAQMHAVADKFGLANGFTDAVPKSKRLADLASTLRRFVKAREQK